MDAINIREEICSGAPTLKGRRLTVFNVVSKIHNENSLEEALDDYEITLSSAKEAVHYCSNLLCQEDKQLIKFCSGCLLRTLQDGWHFEKNNFSEISVDDIKGSVSISKDGNRIFLGTIQELEDQEFGNLGWEIASQIRQKYKELI